MYICIILFIVVIIFAYIMMTYNSLTKSKNRVEEAFSTMDIYLKKRWDLIPNLVETLKGYANYEKSTLEKIVELRNNSFNEMNKEDKVNTDYKISKQIENIIVVAEKYPDLKANEAFKNLSKELAEVEDEIANARKYYNGTIRILNNKINMFPSNIVANMMGFTEQKMFEANMEERENVKIKL